MHAVTAVVACRGDNYDAAFFTQVDRSGKERIGLSVLDKLAAAYIDHVCSLAHSSLDCTRKVELREMSTAVAEDWGHQSLTPRREAERAAERLSENHAGDMRAVFGHRASTRQVVYQRVDAPQPGTTEAGMTKIDRSVDDRNAYARIDRYLVSKCAQLTEDELCLGRLGQRQRGLPRPHLSHHEVMLLSSRTARQFPVGSIFGTAPSGVLLHRVG